MNWLAHLYLSDDDPAMRFGNLVADLVKGSDRQRLSDEVRRGIVQHQRIDALTDHDPLFCRSKRRVPERFDRFAGILIDILYDHLLARDWPRYSAVPLAEFTASVYATFDDFFSQIPDETRAILMRMASQDWLGSYRTLAGIEDVLRRLSRRIESRIGVDPRLHEAVPMLADEMPRLADDFAAFFPVIQAACGKSSPVRCADNSRTAM
jgi:acyl carrier protein phosphodiesterase